MDELMMDWLYDELDPASSARVAEHIGTCLRCSAEAGSLRRAREAFRDLPLLDPPASVSAILLHEAARRGQPAAVAAAEARTGTGVPATPRLVDRLRGWLRPLVMHPALSATATLILVAGVAGTLYVRGRAGTAPSPAAETIAPAAPAAPAPGSERRFATPPGDRVGPDRLDGTEQAGLEQARSAGDRSVADDADHAAKMERKPAAEEREQVAKTARNEQPDRRRLAKKAPPAETTNAPSSRAGAAARESLVESGAVADATGPAGLASGPGAAGTAAAPLAAAPEPSVAAEVAPYEPGRGRDRVDRDQPPSGEDLVWLQAQELRLGELARKKLCREAAQVANDILDRNPHYYAREVLPSTDVQPCSRTIRDEQRRRAARRVQEWPAKAGAKRGAAGPPPKAKAAPEKDEAAAKQRER